MNRDLPVAHLRTLIAIAEENSFEAAAKRVNRTQPAVTQQMKRLEDVVECQLFVQQGRQRVLTAAGETLLDYARDIVSLSDSAIKATRSTSDTAVLRIGVPHEISKDLLPEVLSRFADHCPDVRVIVQINRSPELMNELRDRQLDIAVTTRSGEQEEAEKILTVPTFWIGSETFVPDLTRPLPLVLSDEPSIFRRIALMALDLAGLKYEERFTSSTLPGLQSAVESGLGITVRTPSSFSGKTRILGQQFGLPELPSVNYFAHSGRAEPTHSINEMLRLIAEASKTVTWSES